VATNLTSNISVLKNTSSPGSISFASKQDLPGVSPIGLSIGDIDGDSKPDLAVANFGSGKVSVWRNNSSTSNISFLPALNYASGNGPAEVYIGDIDGDGFPDLSLTNTQNNIVTVLKTPVTPPKLNLGNDTTLCLGDSLLLNAFIPDGSYEWSTGKQSATEQVKGSGTYWVKVNVGSFTVRDTIVVEFKQPPTLNLGSDLSVCDNENKVLKANVPNAIYLWQDGSSGDALVIKTAGLYWLQVYKDGCAVRDSVNVTVNRAGIMNIGNDTAICSGSEYFIDAFQNDIVTYQWQNGSTAPQFKIQQPGVYWLKVQYANGCSNMDSIKVLSKQPPSIEWDNDSVYCSSPILLKPNANSGSYLWQDGSTSSTIWATKPGDYTVEIRNECGAAKGTISITEGLCELYMPNAFTPNGDGKNDIFRIKNPQFVREMKMQIFNRWGEVVFITSDSKKGWDGKYKNREQPLGNYVWIISLIDTKGQSKTYSGNVVLIR
jgi:gliding motility-associated-like protein